MLPTTGRIESIVTSATGLRSSRWVSRTPYPIRSSIGGPLLPTENSATFRPESRITLLIGLAQRRRPSMSRHGGRRRQTAELLVTDLAPVTALRFCKVTRRQAVRAWRRTTDLAPAWVFRRPRRLI